MPAALDIPVIKNARAFHLKRWRDICNDAYYQSVEGKVETNCFGQVIMMPPPGFSHSDRQGTILQHLTKLMPSGRSLPEVAVLTSDGVKGVDVVWISEARIKKGLAADVLTIAPEICIEVFSPSNTRNEIDEKKQLYFAAGAEEVWICDRSGRVHFFLKKSPNRAVKSSALCPEMAGKV
ncbi:MAG: Uma2 family endonuclease [Verrucomicrobiaceae bacterium]|nr:Uma2 family endonuclease [Verrucomicrobiaceae bacterium]